jgi:hypothetical protein
MAVINQVRISYHAAAVNLKPSPKCDPGRCITSARESEPLSLRQAPIGTYVTTSRAGTPRGRVWVQAELGIALLDEVDRALASYST